LKQYFVTERHRSLVDRIQINWGRFGLYGNLICMTIFRIYFILQLLFCSNLESWCNVIGQNLMLMLFMVYFIVYCFKSSIRTWSLHNCWWRTAKPSTFQQEGTLIVSHLLWQGASFLRSGRGKSAKLLVCTVWSNFFSLFSSLYTCIFNNSTF
jgi:hypothetical protein